MKYIKRPKKNKDLINHDIPFEKFILVDENKKNLGIITKKKALQIAEEKKLDILCVKINLDIPICRMINYDNYRFQKQKNIKKNIKNKKQNDEKEIRFSASIASNDLKIKINKCREFLGKKKKVKISMRLRGREKYVENYGLDKINTFLEMIKDVSKVTKPPKLENNTYNVLVEHLGKKETKKNNEK